MILVRKLKIYIDVLLLVNFLFDFILLLTTKHLLKRKTKTSRLFLATIIGEISIIIIFLPLSSISILLLKLLISILMTITAFGYKEYLYFKKNILTFYMLSIILGGIVYFLKISLVSKKDIITNILILLIISPYILYKYFKDQVNFKLSYSLRHDITIYLNKKIYKYVAYLDTGNKLEDPYKKRPIILVNDDKLNFSYENSILVPYKTLDSEGIIKCQKVEKVIIDQKIELTNILIGQSKKKFNIEGIDVILPNIIKEEL